VLDEGALVFCGTADQCVASYEAKNADAKGAVWQREDRPENKSLALVRISSAINGQQPSLRLDLEIELESNAAHKPAFLAVDVLDSAGSGLLQAIPKLEGYLLASAPRHLVRLDVDLPPLIPGTYLVTVWVGSHNSETLDEAKEVVAFEVHDSPTPGRTFPHTRDHGYVVPSSNVSVHG
jgi:lipopolysaccharide transport system ATP-binding protein